MAKKENNEKNVNMNINKEEKEMAKAAKEAQQAVAVEDNNGTIIGATTHGFIYQKPMAGAQEEIIDLGKFGKRTLRWGKGLECSKVYDGDKEVAYIFWEKSGEPVKIRLLNEEEKHYYMLSYDQTSFIYFENKEKKVVMDSKLATALMFFYRNFVLRIAELKGWKLPEKRQPYYNDKGYWEALEREHEAEEAAYQAARAAKNSKA